MVSLRILSLAALCGLGIAHPGEHHDAAKRRRDLHHNEIGIRNAEAALARCKDTQNGQTMARRAAIRRAAKAAELREKRDIEHSRSSHLDEMSTSRRRFGWLYEIGNDTDCGD